MNSAMARELTFLFRMACSMDPRKEIVIGEIRISWWEVEPCFGVPRFNLQRTEGNPQNLNPCPLSDTPGKNKKRLLSFLPPKRSDLCPPMSTPPPPPGACGSPPLPFLLRRAGVAGPVAQGPVHGVELEAVVHRGGQGHQALREKKSWVSKVF